MSCPADGNDINHYLSEMRFRQGGNNAYRRLPVFLPMHKLQKRSETETRGLLRVLFVRIE
jgi:hypothetical protein